MKCPDCSKEMSQAIDFLEQGMLKYYECDCGKIIFANGREFLWFLQEDKQ